MGNKSTKCCSNTDPKPSRKKKRPKRKKARGNSEKGREEEGKWCKTESLIYLATARYDH